MPLLLTRSQGARSLSRERTNAPFGFRRLYAVGVGSEEALVSPPARAIYIYISPSSSPSLSGAIRESCGALDLTFSPSGLLSLLRFDLTVASYSPRLKPRERYPTLNGGPSFAASHYTYIRTRTHHCTYGGELLYARFHVRPIQSRNKSPSQNYRPGISRYRKAGRRRGRRRLSRALFRSPFACLSLSRSLSVSSAP